MVKIQNLTFLYKNFPPIFEDFNWHIKKGESWSVLGASGSGKTTLLHLLSSLKYPDSGSIEIKGESLLRPRPETGLILQNHGLLPWASIKKNIELGFRIRRFYGPDGRHSPSNFKSDKNHEKILTRKWMKKMGIDELKDRYPHEISGGQQQRTAIARTLI
ncbi:MAG: ATP-binding cassette domain-containing protein, partial [Spirochaetaceae bacterium]|nr:ATP-binding cassette domain-containing protein [Spirochaetaceae bacterium]